MSKTLSQEEIDSLLDSLKTGAVPIAASIETASQPWRQYDFRRALHFSKDHFRIIRRIFEQFARQFANRLGARLRTVASLQVESVDELPYEEFIGSIPRLTMIQLLELAPLNGRVAWEMNMQLVFAMIDYFEGGVGQAKYEERELTDIETRLIRNVLGEMKSPFIDAWATFIDLKPTFDSVETNPQFVQIASPNESVLLVTMQMKIGETSGLVNFCIPYITIEEIVPKLSTRSYFTTAKTTPEEMEPFQSALGHHIKNSEVNISVSLGDARLRIQEVLDLEVGDVIQLDQYIYRPLTMLSDDVPVFLGNIGTSGSHYALKISEPWKDGTEIE